MVVSRADSHTARRVSGGRPGSGSRRHAVSPAVATALATGADRATPDTEAYVTQYVAGEVAYLSGTGFTHAVGKSLGQSDPADIDVLQEIGTAVIDFSGEELVAPCSSLPFVARRSSFVV